LFSDLNLSSILFFYFSLSDTHFNIDKTPFADRAFAVLDEDQSGELDYHEFLAGVWSMCSGSARDQVLFLFSLFDEDGSNSLDDAEVESALRMLHNADPLPEHIQEQFDAMVTAQRAKELLEDPDDDPDEILINVNDFLGYNEQHGDLLQPALDLRDTLRKQIRGKKYWKKMERKRQELFSGANLDDILFSKKRARAAAEEAERDKRAQIRKDKEVKLKAIRKQKKKEAYEARIKEKWDKATPEESEYREACKGVARAREVWEEAEKDGASKEECVRLRRRLQQAEQDREEALNNIEALWQRQEEAEKKRRKRITINLVIKKFATYQGKKEINGDAKMMRWTFHLLPQVNPIFTGFDKISFKDCKERVMQERFDIAVKIEMKKVKKEYKRIRKEEGKFIREEVLKDPWEEGPWDAESSESEESDQESVFMDDDDWVLHVSVQGCNFQSVDIRQWHEICGTVPKRILHAAGIRLDWQKKGSKPRQESKNQIMDDGMKLEDI
jgi:hypothetical protein